MSTTAQPLLEAHDLRVDAGGRVLCEHLSLELTAERSVLLGAGAAAIASAVSLRGRIVQGSLAIQGHDVGSRQHVARVGFSAADTPVPPRMTVTQLLELSFRTAGHSRRQGHDLAVLALQEAGLSSLATRRTESLALPERRALAVAQALLPDVPVVFFSSPLDGLEGPAAAVVLQALGLVARKRKVIATATRLDSSSSQRDLLSGAQHVIIAESDRVVWSGPPNTLAEQTPVTALKLARDADAFLTQLLARGFLVHGEPPRVTVTAPTPDATEDLFQLAQQTGAVIVEMEPLVTERRPPMQAPHQGAAPTGAASPPSGAPPP